MIKKCKICNIEFIPKKDTIKRILNNPLRNVFCSIKCRNTYIASLRKIFPKKIGICIECKNDIVAKNASFVKPKNGRKFCSKHCQIIWQNKNIKQTTKRIAKRSNKNHYNWKGGITPKNKKIRHSLKSVTWRKNVFNRDDYIDQKTGIKGGKLVVHHILNFAQYPELRFELSNGITLSDKSHKEFHRIYGIKNNTKEQLLEFLSI